MLSIIADYEPNGGTGYALDFLTSDMVQTLIKSAHRQMVPKVQGERRVALALPTLREGVFEACSLHSRNLENRFDQEISEEPLKGFKSGSSKTESCDAQRTVLSLE